MIQIFLQHNAVVCENCEKCMQTLIVTRSRMYKLDKSGKRLEPLYLRLVPSTFWYIEDLVTSLCQASKLASTYDI